MGCNELGSLLAKVNNGVTFPGREYADIVRLPSSTVPRSNVC